MKSSRQFAGFSNESLPTSGLRKAWKLPPWFKASNHASCDLSITQDLASKTSVPNYQSLQGTKLHRLQSAVGEFQILRLESWSLN